MCVRACCILPVLALDGLRLLGLQEAMLAARREGGQYGFRLSIKGRLVILRLGTDGTASGAANDVLTEGNRFGVKDCGAPFFLTLKLLVLGCVQW